MPPDIVERKVCTVSGQLPGRYCPGTIDEVFIAGTEPTDTCTIHRMYKIDVRTLMFANRGTPRQYVEKKVFEVLPPIFDRWAAREGIRVPPGSALLANSRVVHASYPGIMNPGFAIMSLEDGAVFKIDPVLRRMYQDVAVAVAVGEEYRFVKLYIDGRLFSNLSGRSEVKWNLHEGEHDLQLVGKCGDRLVRSGIVHVTVYR